MSSLEKSFLFSGDEKKKKGPQVIDDEDTSQASSEPVAFQM